MHVVWYFSHSECPMDITLELVSITLEDIKNISKVTLQENKKLMQNMQKEVGKTITDKNKDISYFRDHSEKLLMQINNENKLLETKDKNSSRRCCSSYNNQGIIFFTRAKFRVTSSKNIRNLCNLEPNTILHTLEL